MKFTEGPIGIMFVIIGICLIIGGIFLVNASNKFNEVAEQTVATVIDTIGVKDSEGKISHVIYIEYVVDGKNYNGQISSNYNPAKGEKTIIYYDRNNPSIMKTSLKNGNNIVMIILGITLSSAGIGLFYYERNKSIKNKNLKETGDKIYADFKEIERKFYYAASNEQYVIICYGKDNITGEERIFRSEIIWENPEYIINARNITKFSVYIDRSDRKKYYVSLEELE